MKFRLRFIKQGRVVWSEEIELADELAARKHAHADMSGADWCEVTEIKQPQAPMIRVAEIVTTKR